MSGRNQRATVAATVTWVVMMAFVAGLSLDQHDRFQSLLAGPGRSEWLLGALFYAAFLIPMLVIALAEAQGQWPVWLGFVLNWAMYWLLFRFALAMAGWLDLRRGPKGRDGETS